MVVDKYAVSFATLRDRANKDYRELNNIYTYLENLPESFEHAIELKDYADDLVKEGESEGIGLITNVKILPPMPRPVALLDFALSPRHLLNSTRIMLRYEWGSLMSNIVSSFLKKRLYAMSLSSMPPYYKGNHLTIIGDGDDLGWPSYTSYLGIEPELAILTGNPEHQIAGYLIFNDVSARDVQFQEMFGSGPNRSKDFSKGNGLGPFLVTPDEIPSPLSLDGTTKIGTRLTWRGSTSEYTMQPEELVSYFRRIYTFLPGIVLGMGTVPGCTGLDNDQWVNPDEMIEITFDGLGTLHQHIPEKPAKLEKSRWPQRF